MLKVLRANAFYLIISAIITLLLTLPILNNKTAIPQFLYFDDALELWILQLMQLHEYLKDFTFYALDFSTHGGSSEFSLRPNLIVFHPFFVLTGVLCNVCYSSIASVAALILTVFIISIFFCLFFLQKLCVEFFGLDKVLGIFVAVSYTCCEQLFNVIGFMPFIYIVLAFPIFIYFLLKSALGNKFCDVAIASFMIIVLFTSGYIPLSLMATALAVTFALVYIIFIDRPEINFREKSRNLFFLFLPVIISSAVLLPYVLAIKNYTKIVGSSWDLPASAHQFSNHPSEIINFFSRNLSPSTHDIGNDQSLVFGVTQLAIVILFISSAISISNKDSKLWRLLAISLISSLSFLLVCFGDSSALSDMFFYLTPLGKMHIYARYFLFFNLFIFLASAIMLKFALEQKKNRVWKIMLVLTSALIIFACLKMPNNDISQKFIFELILLAIFLLTTVLISSYEEGYKYLALPIIFATLANALPATNHFYDLSAKNTEFARHALANLEKSRGAAQLMKQHSNKEIIKYLDIAPGLSIIMDIFPIKNAPWLNHNIGNFSTYNGYEVHLASDIKYQRLNPLAAIDQKRYFLADKNYILSTGPDYLIFDNSSKQNSEFVNKVSSQLDLTKTFTIAPNLTLVAFKPYNDGKSLFDNGYVRISSLQENSMAKVENFKTNNANYISFRLSSDKETSLTYLFWPNKKIVVTIDGLKQKTEITNHLLSVKLPAKEHAEIKIIIEDRKMQAFKILYCSYFLVLALIIIWKSLHCLRRRKNS